MPPRPELIVVSLQLPEELVPELFSDRRRCRARVGRGGRLMFDRWASASHAWSDLPFAALRVRPHCYAALCHVCLLSRLELGVQMKPCRAL